MFVCVYFTFQFSACLTFVKKAALLETERTKYRVCSFLCQNANNNNRCHKSFNEILISVFLEKKTKINNIIKLHIIFLNKI